MASKAMDLSVYPDDYATDDVSATSTVESEAGEDYDVEEIVAERLELDAHGREETRYLIKWAGYNPDRCTWEPVESLIDLSLLHAWEARKKSMSTAAFESYCTKNVHAFEDAETLANNCKTRRHQKRLKKRMRFKQTREARARPTISESDDDKPLVVKVKTRQSETSSKKPTKFRDPNFSRAPRKQTMDQPAFVDDTLFVQDPNDTIMEETEKSRKQQAQEKPETDREKPQASSSTPLSRTLSERRITTEPGATGPKPHAERPGEAVSDLPTTTRRKSDPATTTPLNNASKARNVVTSAGSELATSKSITTGKADAIKIVNEPKTQARGDWNTTGKLFTTLHFRAVAEKRSRREGTPDPSALDFVNGQPTGISPRPAEPRPRTRYDDPYGRRESGNRRLQDLTSDDIPGSGDGHAPLKPFEQQKIPQTCFEWHNRSCQYRAEDCRFLHRRTDPSGKEYSLSPWNGIVLPKYADPPRTCFHWLRDEGGCRNSAEDCKFAHKNTGLLGIVGGASEQIDPHELPRSSSKPSQNREPREGNEIRPVRHVTCFYWFTSPFGCSKSPEDCKYAHENTGLLASPHGWEEIDPSLRPLCDRNTSSTNVHPTSRTSSPKVQSEGKTPSTKTQLSRSTSNLDLHPGNDTSSPMVRPGGSASNVKLPANKLTCFFWNIGECRKSDEKCAFLHRYTGQVADPPRSMPWLAQRREPLRDRPETTASVEDPIRGAHQDDVELNVEIGDDTAQTHDRPEALSRPQPAELALPQLPCLDLKHEIDETLKLDFSQMFIYNNDQLSDQILERRAFLLFHPEEHMEELELITRWLLMHHVDVYTFWSDGAWDHFKRQVLEGGTGTIIAHPDFEHWADIPNFGEVLRGKVRVWSVGLQPEREHDPQISTFEPVSRYDCIEIFPHGGIIYITDHVFTKKAEEALKIFELFFEKIEQCRQRAGPIDPGKRVDDGCLLWRIAVRPELMQALYDSSVMHEAEIEARDPFHMSLWKLYELFAATTYIEQEDAEPFAHRPVDYFPVMSERHCFMEDYYYTAQKQGQVHANTKMIEYYGGVLLDQRQYYRQFFVVHPDPDSNEAKDWKARITNIDEVMSPEKFIEEFKKEPKGNRFEFYEWSLPLKRDVDRASR